jgi:hypothetical protein
VQRGKKAEGKQQIKKIPSTLARESTRFQHDQDAAKQSLVKSEGNIHES